MKTADLKPGAMVAYTEDRYSTPAKVEVLETGVSLEPNVPRWASYGRKVAKSNGVRVKYADARHKSTFGVEVVVDPKTLTEPWEEYLANKRAMAQAKADNEAQKHASRTENARVAKALSDAALANGLPPRRGYLYDEEILDYVLGAGFVPDEKRYPSESGYHFKCAFNSIHDVVVKGEVDLDVVAVAMGLTQAPEPTEYDDYSPETIAAETEQED